MIAKKKTKLKCFVVHDGDESSSIQFSTHAVKARRVGASEMGISFDEVESCKRKPAWDKYAPGPVPVAVTMEEGWRWGCSHCERMISEDGPDWREAEEIQKAGYFSESTAPNPQIIEWGGQRVFCGPECAAAEIERKRLKDIIKEALEEWGIAEVKRLYPEAKCLDLEARSEASGFEPWWVIVPFRFPGCTYPAHFEWNKDHDEKRPWGRKNGVSISRIDEPAWVAFLAGRKASA